MLGTTRQRITTRDERCCSTKHNLAAQAQDGIGTDLLHPRVYFSPRRSPAPDTEGAAAAETAGAGCGAVGGVGAAWLWRGEVRTSRTGRATWTVP